MSPYLWQSSAFCCVSVQVLLKWNTQRGVPVIPRSQSEKNIRGNIKDAFTWELTPDQKVSRAKHLCSVPGNNVLLSHTL